VTSEAVRLYRPRDVADLVGCSLSWVYERMNDGSLPRVELGSGRAKQRIRADDLQAFIEARTFGRAPVATK
jgi:excisionase family DNA binding protein